MSTLPKIFIGYRSHSGTSSLPRLRSGLQSSPTVGGVFIAPDDIPPGARFDRKLRDEVLGATVFLAIVTVDWEGRFRPLGIPRLWAAGDWVRRELELARASQMTIIPVVVDGARLPPRWCLPATLKFLTDLQAIPVDSRNFQFFLEKLGSSIPAAHAATLRRRRALQDYRKWTRLECSRLDRRRRIKTGLLLGFCTASAAALAASSGSAALVVEALGRRKSGIAQRLPCTSFRIRDPTTGSCVDPTCHEGSQLVAGGHFDEEPPFCLGTTEVTLADYLACKTCPPLSGTTVHGAAPASEREDPLCNTDEKSKGDHPVNCVTHTQATEYCAHQGGRLPTGLEWIWAAQGRTASRRYPWGSSPPTCAEVTARIGDVDCDDIPGTEAVGRHPAGRTIDGVEDMAGNVWEWTATPTPSGRSYLTFGGSWSVENSDHIEVDRPASAHPGSRRTTLGFRCRFDATPPQAYGIASPHAPLTSKD